MKLILILALVLCACTDDKRDEKPTSPLVKKKICIQACTDHEFENFHHNGSSWGTGSSSMNGLSQTQIYDAVQARCEKFYADEQCCQYTWEMPHSILAVHGWQFGPCLQHWDEPTPPAQGK